MCHDTADQAPPFECGARIDAITGEGQLRGPGVPDRTRQEPGSAIAGDQAELDEAFGERCAFGGDANVAHHRQVAAGTDGRTVDRRDQRHFETGKRSRYPLDTVDIGAPLVDRAQAEHATAVGHVFDIAACGEDLAGSGQHDRTDGSVTVRRIDSLLECSDDGRVGDGVADLRQGDGPDLNCTLCIDVQW